MNKLKKYLFYGMPILLISGIGLTIDSKDSLNLPQILMFFVLLYLIQIAWVPLFGNHLLILTLIHLFTYKIILHLIFDFHLWLHFLEYSLIITLIYWRNNEFKKH